MRTLFLAIPMLLLACAASGADAVCSIPSAAVTPVLALCEKMQLRHGISSVAWDEDACASEFMRTGIGEWHRRVTRAEAEKVMFDDVKTAVDEFEAVWPRNFVLAQCGDGNVDTEFGEECDDGNTEDGDGCDSNCLDE